MDILTVEKISENLKKIEVMYMGSVWAYISLADNLR